MKAPGIQEKYKECMCRIYSRNTINKYFESVEEGKGGQGFQKKGGGYSKK